MKKVIRLIMVGVLATATLAGCKKDDPATTPTAPTENVLSGNLETMTLDASKVYTLKGLVYVNNGKTLTIPAGTLILGDKASKASLVINRGGKLIANGTASKPIIFTSSAPAPYKNYGDWGGIVICGKAPNNQGTDITVEGPTDFSVTTGNGIYGGTDEADNSGSLSYVRLEFGGIVYSPDKEINGLTLCSVGSATTIDHIQVSYSGDDAVEWFGGSVNCKYLVQYRTWDDDFDTDFGYHGNVQFGVSMRDRTVADVSASNAFESDNDATGSTKTPLTSAKFSNITIMGPLVYGQSNVSANFGAGMHLRRNTNLTVQNSIIAGYPTAANFDKYNTTVANFVKNNLYGSWKAANSSNANGALFTAGNNNDTTGFWAANKFAAVSSATSAAQIFDFTANTGGLPDLSSGNATQVSTSKGLTGASFTDLPAPFFTTTTYLGAMGTTPDAAWDWTSGWLNFTPESTTY
ncbi:hypothetical protein [Cytophaga aurantiaca]|uniref:hypothetical protein n=1 Tax=Cytophaga aurantiaca TaxID=29530 RepID=UPI0003768692|nr:hypothetical protein [Cytophaga aurantiaca]